MNDSCSAAFDGFTAANVRPIDLAAQAAGGPITLRLWTDALVAKVTGALAKFPFDERRYVAEALDAVESVVAVDDANDAVSSVGQLEIPDPPTCPADPAGKKVLVTGCYDLMHSGHIRFFEEASAFGDLYVVVGHDANIKLLKGNDRPLVSDRERCYLCNAVRNVKLALVSSGHGWLDAAPEIERLRPDIYLVNEDGDNDEKRDFCAQAGLEYVVLPRTPPPGLTPRSSTQLRSTMSR
ncbi:MAG: adenylyltransferase/cytidyltransferase family protein [Planctomycetota bacterium]